MSFLFSAIKYGLIILFVPIILSYFHKLSKLVGAKEYNKEEIQQFRKKRYPNYYKYIYYSLIAWLFLSMFIAMFIVSFMIFSWLPMLSQTLFVDGETLLFRSISGWIDVIVFLYLYVSTFTIVDLIPICVVLLIFKDFNAFYAMLHSKNKSIPGNIPKLKHRQFLIIITGLVLVAIPLVALKVNSYIKIADEKIFINKFIDIKGKDYSWDDVRYVKLYGIYNRKHKCSTVHFELEMQDNSNILLWTSNNLQKGFIIPSKEELKGFIEKIKIENVEIKIQDKYLEYLRGESDKWDREKGKYIYERLLMS